MFQHHNDTLESLLRDPSQHRQQIESALKVVPMPSNKAALQREIRFNMAYCQANRLSQTAKWLGELLVTIQVPASESKMDQGPSEVFSDSVEESDLPNTAAQSASSSFNKVFFEHPSEVADKLNLSRTLFDLKEYRKCAHNLQSLSASNQSALFLRNFSTYLFCEQKSEELNLESGDKV